MRGLVFFIICTLSIQYELWLGALSLLFMGSWVLSRLMKREEPKTRTLFYFSVTFAFGLVFAYTWYYLFWLKQNFANIWQCLLPAAMTSLLGFGVFMALTAAHMKGRLKRLWPSAVLFNLFCVFNWIGYWFFVIFAE